jgi:hypothetical protein
MVSELKRGRVEAPAEAPAVTRSGGGGMQKCCTGTCSRSSNHVVEGLRGYSNGDRHWDSSRICRGLKRAFNAPRPD